MTGDIKSNVKKLADANGLNIAQIAEQAGLSRNTVHRYYHDDFIGRYEREVLIKLCELFNCQIGDLLEYVVKE